MTTDGPISRSSWTRAMLVASVGVSVIIVASALAFYVVVVKMPTDLAHNTANGFKEFFNFTPRVNINETVVIEENVPILEVSTVSRDLQVEIAWTDQWLGSRKTVELQASFTAKAGFDLTEPFVIDIRRYPLDVRATLPDPTLLSLQMNTYTILKDEDGWWNRVSDSDREKAIAYLLAAARERAQTSGILKEAETTAKMRVREIIERSGATVQFRRRLDGTDNVVR